MSEHLTKTVVDRSVSKRNPVKEESWPKVCSCCEAEIFEDDWEKMSYVGIQKGNDVDFDYPDLELRNCGHCSSTLAIVVPSDFVF